MKIREATECDAVEVLALYRRVAAIPNGIARLAAEINAAYVRGFLKQALANGIALLIEKEGEVIAEIHAHRPDPECFSHVLSDLTVVVDPRMQGRGLGRMIFESFLSVVIENNTDVSRVELFARQSNARAIQLYRSLGFKAEGTFAARIRNADGSLDSDIPMAWLRTNANAVDICASSGRNVNQGSRIVSVDETSARDVIAFVEDPDGYQIELIEKA